MTPEVAALLRRAESELRLHRPYLAFRLYRHAASLLDGASQLEALQRALDVCLEYFSQDADETIEVTEELCRLSDDRDGRALVALGVAFSVKSRRTHEARQFASARQEAELAITRLRRATELFPFDTDAWGSLGGVYKRLAQWESRSDASAAQQHRNAMLDAYRRGMEAGSDPYPTLNYLECRASAERAGPVVRKPEEVRLQRALDICKHQFARGENAPWAAFDLARGQHYLKPNVPRFLPAATPLATVIAGYVAQRFGAPDA